MIFLLDSLVDSIRDPIDSGPTVSSYRCNACPVPIAQTVTVSGTARPCSRSGPDCFKEGLYQGDEPDLLPLHEEFRVTDQDRTGKRSR